MSEHNQVTSLFGGPTGERVRNETCVTVLREWLERAEAGEAVGVTIVGKMHDGTAVFDIAGVVGGFAMIGAMETAKADLTDVARGLLTDE